MFSTLSTLSFLSPNIGVLFIKSEHIYLELSFSEGRPLHSESNLTDPVESKGRSFANENVYNRSGKRCIINLKLDNKQDIDLTISSSCLIC